MPAPYIVLQFFVYSIKARPRPANVAKPTVARELAEPTNGLLLGFAAAPVDPALPATVPEALADPEPELDPELEPEPEPEPEL